MERGDRAEQRRLRSVVSYRQRIYIDFHLILSRVEYLNEIWLWVPRMKPGGWHNYVGQFLSAYKIRSATQITVRCWGPPKPGPKASEPCCSWSLNSCSFQERHAHAKPPLSGSSRSRACTCSAATAGTSVLGGACAGGRSCYTISVS